LDELSQIGIPTDGVRLSKQGGGVWLAGVEGMALARASLFPPEIRSIDGADW